MLEAKKQLVIVDGQDNIVCMGDDYWLAIGDFINRNGIVPVKMGDDAWFAVDYFRDYDYEHTTTYFIPDRYIAKDLSSLIELACDKTGARLFVKSPVIINGLSGITYFTVTITERYNPDGSVMSLCVDYVPLEPRLVKALTKTLEPGALSTTTVEEFPKFYPKTK